MTKWFPPHCWRRPSKIICIWKQQKGFLAPQGFLSCFLSQMKYFSPLGAPLSHFKFRWCPDNVIIILPSTLLCFIMSHGHDSICALTLLWGRRLSDLYGCSSMGQFVCVKQICTPFRHFPVLYLKWLTFCQELLHTNELSYAAAPLWGSISNCHQSGKLNEWIKCKLLLHHIWLHFRFIFQIHLQKKKKKKLELLQRFSTK